MARLPEKADAATTLRPTYLRARFAERLPLTLQQRNARRKTVVPRYRFDSGYTHEYAKQMRLVIVLLSMEIRRPFRRNPWLRSFGSAGLMVTRRGA